MVRPGIPLAKAPSESDLPYVGRMRGLACAGSTVLVAVAALLALLTRVSAAQTNTPLLWAADAEGGAPYIFKDPKDPNRHVGFEVDLASALQRELGRPIAFHQYDYKSLISGAQRGDFDFAMNGIEITESL